MCVRPYPSHITQCKPIVTSHSLRAWGKRKSLREKTNVLSLFLFVHMFLTKKKKQFLCFTSPKAVKKNVFVHLPVLFRNSAHVPKTCTKTVRPDEEWVVQTQWQFYDLCRCFNATPLLYSIKHWSLFKSKETIWMLHGSGEAVCGQPSSKASDRRVMMQQSSKCCISMRPGENTFRNLKFFAWNPNDVMQMKKIILKAFFEIFCVWKVINENLVICLNNGQELELKSMSSG